MPNTIAVAEDLAMLHDHGECCRLIASYAPAVDWIDGTELLRIFWPRANVDLGVGFFKGPVEDYVKTVIEGIETTFLRRMHNPGYVHTRILGDRAHAENAAVNQTLVQEPTQLVLSTYTGRYLWKLEKRSGSWRIAAMQFLLVSAQHAQYDVAGEFPGLNLAEPLSARADFFR